eukprot:gene4229-6567_t
MATPSRTKVLPNEWQARRSEVTTTAQTARCMSNDVRTHALRTARDCTQRLQRVVRDTENELNLRIDWVEQRRRDLKRSIEDIETEISYIIQLKEGVDEQFGEQSQPTVINKECQDLRSKRYGIDLVADDVDAELEEECRLLQQVNEVMEQALDDIKEQLRLLRAIKYALEKDLKAKETACNIDMECRSLDRSSTDINSTMNDLHIDSKCIDPEVWNENTEYNLRNADDERSRSKCLREDVEDMLKNAKDQMMQQANKTKSELESMERVVEDLDCDIQDKLPNLKLAKARLQKRNLRPDTELVRDPVQLTLSREVQEIEDSLNGLQREKADAEHTVLSLRRTVVELEDDVNCKTNTLNLDNR